MSKRCRVTPNFNYTFPHADIPILTRKMDSETMIDKDKSDSRRKECAMVRDLEKFYTQRVPKKLHIGVLDGVNLGSTGAISHNTGVDINDISIITNSVEFQDYRPENSRGCTFTGSIHDFFMQTTRKLDGVVGDFCGDAQTQIPQLKPLFYRKLWEDVFFLTITLKNSRQAGNDVYLHGTYIAQTLLNKYASDNGYLLNSCGDPHKDVNMTTYYYKGIHFNNAMANNGGFSFVKNTKRSADDWFRRHVFELYDN